MSRAKIVLADNNPSYRVTLKEILERSGCEVIATSTPDETRAALSRPDVELAILDVRLEKDDDDKDITGLLLAADPAFFSIPKIILTDYTTKTREHLKRNAGGALPLYVEFLDKAIGHEGILDAVTKNIATATFLRLRRPGEGQSPSPENRKVFIVHGHDEGAKRDVEILLRRLRLEPVILNEQVGGGKTIIEALEHHGEVSFAIVILTPDDFGGLQAAAEVVNARARQNVIFEMGYFIGKLGRRRVHALLKDAVEIPSDLRGVIYTEMDAHKAWEMRLTRELRAAGFDMDLRDFWT